MTQSVFVRNSHSTLTDYANLWNPSPGCLLFRSSTSPSCPTLSPQMTNTNRTELEFFLNEKCKEDSDLLATIISEYVWGLTPSKLTELEDFLANNFGDD